MKNKMAKFSIEDNFFIIDSNNLDSIKTKLYGFGILDDLNEISDDKLNLSAIGAYIYIYSDETKITISQDYIGCYDLYFFQDKDYFALSNSFIYLVDYIKTKHKITLNKDYANYLLIGALCSEIYNDNLVNEISTFPRNTVISIDKRTKKIKIGYIDYKENTVEFGTDEYFDILDNWYNRWTNIIHHLDNLTMDLSGGMDSRIILSLFLGSEIDLNTIEVHTYTDGLHCHTEDFEIASQIANDYKFTLNKKLNIQTEPFSLKDIINLSFYTKLGFHKEMYWKENKYITSKYRFGGHGGGMIRDYRRFWNFANIYEFIKIRQHEASIYSNSKELQLDISNSIEKVIKNSSHLIKNNNIFKKFEESNFLANFYRETRCRNHFGKAIVEDYLCGTVTFAPLLDPELSKLKLNSKDCLDKDLLLTFIFTRFSPNLLNYKFEGKRFIDKETIEFAKKINKQKPFKKDNVFCKKEYKIIKSTDLYPQKTYEENIIVKEDELSPFDFLLNVYKSKEFRYLFTIYFPKSILDSIDKDIEKRKYHPLKIAYGVIGITKIINDVLISKSLNSDTVFDINNNFLFNSDKKYCLFDFCDSLQLEIKTKNEQLQQKNEQIKTKNEQLQQKNEQIKNRDSAIKQKNGEIQNLRTKNNDLLNQNNIQDLAIKRLQNSWSYRIGRLFTYPLSIPLDFYRFIRDYNLLKKSNLFDSEYYLANNEDVEKAKMNPIKHYLKFGWKEGRNPSVEFDGNEYLNKRPDVRVAGICPLVHYIKFRKE